MRQLLKYIAYWCVILMASNAHAEEKNIVIAIVVASNSAIETPKLSPNQLSLIYWRKQLFWAKGLRIKPVNLSTEHPLRLPFSQVVLGSAPKAQIDYWNGQYFNGVLPPYSVNSEEAVLRYVAQTAGAIGYLDACNIDARVQAVLWVNQNQISTQAPENLHCK